MNTQEKATFADFLPSQPILLFSQILFLVGLTVFFKFLALIFSFVRDYYFQVLREI